ncbi:MAG: DNA gyrase/topoisomerase IV subunit B, partial [Myxococcota bacterium]
MGQPPVNEKGYDESSIDILEGLEPVRKRPGMYIGGTGRDGFHHLLWEIVDNSVDEAINDYADTITVVLHRSNRTVSVSDNGRGIPVGLHPKKLKPTLELILTTLHAGGKFSEGGYITSGGLHGVGSSVVNALSEQLVATIRRDGAEWSQEYRRGKPREPLKRLGPSRKTGTTIRFTPDREIFGEQFFDAELIERRLLVSSFLNKGLKIIFRDEVNSREVVLQHDGGVADFAQHVVEREGMRTISDEPFVLYRSADPRLEIALLWTESTSERLRSFVNGIPTTDGGTHEQGLKDAINKAVRNYISTHDLSMPRGLKLTSDDIREGVVAICSVFLNEPQFQGQTKERLNNPEARALVEGAIRLDLEQWLNTHTTAADAILGRIIMAARARVASRAASTQVRRKSAVNRRLNLPGKLSDCSSSDAESSELFIVEGDSAGGSAKQGRDRKTQAILPLRGKVLNAEQASLKKVLANKELSNIVSALGCGIGADLDISRLRYHKIILLMDADQDGNHIATLLMTFFYRYMRTLIDEGYVYLAQPPLYRVDIGKKTWWATDDSHRDRILKRNGSRGKAEISRFKGLGEMMPKTLFETTLDPRKRRLLQISIPDGAVIETEATIAGLMGKDASN